MIYVDTSVLVPLFVNEPLSSSPSCAPYPGA
jgi:predicted nucleic acid-binding protein